MITCSVLRCTNLGSAFVSGTPNRSGHREAYVCAEHKAMMDGGEPWDMDEHHVLMGRDMPPVLANWSARPSAGALGFTLTLDIKGQLKPLEVFLMPAEAESLSVFIDAANTDGGCEAAAL